MEKGAVAEIVKWHLSKARIAFVVTSWLLDCAKLLAGRDGWRV